MAFPRLGKLPPLQSIGRAVSVDLDEPPDFGDDSDVDNLIQEYENYERGYYYQPEHAISAAEAFSQYYKVLNPGNHVCKCTTNGASSFTHCRKAVSFGQRYQELKRSLEMRAKLEFMREYTSRIQQMTMFVNNVQNMVRAEYHTWRAICKSHLQSPPSTHLESLHAVCEELRVHLYHWNSLKQTVLMDQWLRPILPFITPELIQMRDKIFCVRNCALWWTDRLITVGLRVLAHCDPSQLNSEMLWAVTRGLEDFNTIINIVKLDNLSSQSNTPSYKCYSPSLSRPFNSVTHINMYRNLLEGLKPVPFSRVLNVLAHERCKYAALMTHSFFTGSEELLLMLRATKLPEFNWSRKKGGKNRPSSALDSSDYYTQTGSNDSLGSTLLRVGTVTAPDLSKQDASVAEFASQEQDFATKFLQIVNRSTKLLKRPQESINPAALQSRPGSAKNNRSSTPPLSSKKAVGFGSVSNEDFGTSRRILVSGINDDDNISLCSLSSTLSTRKSVSWGDVGEGGALRQLSDKFMDMLWLAYEHEVMCLFNGPVVGGMSAGRMQLGNVLLCNDITVMMITTMINQTCLKDIFPVGAQVPLYNLARKLHVIAAWRAWDQAYCNAIGSHISDRCSATPLADGEYSTKTGHKLREAFQPLHSVIAILHTGGSDKEKVANLHLVPPTLQKFILTSEFSLKWCMNKCDQYLTHWDVAPFLLVSQSDLKILSDEVGHVLRSSQPLVSSPKKSHRLAASNLTAQLSSLYEKLNNISAQLQMLSGSSIKKFSASCRSRAEEFFEDNMPNGKIWRKKSNAQNMPSSRSEYIENALQLLLEPVISGISELRTTSQISAVSVAVTAVCEEWTKYILKHKIRFSYVGACQLDLDFNYVQEWLSGYLQNKEPVHQSILSLDIFKYLTQAAQLLKQQPYPGSVSRPNSNYSRSTVSCSKSETGVESTEVVSSTQELDSSNITRRIHGPEDDTHGKNHLKSASQLIGTHIHEDDDGYVMENKEQWLALRVHGGARSWPKLPNCFPTTS